MEWTPKCQTNSIWYHTWLFTVHLEANVHQYIFSSIAQALAPQPYQKKCRNTHNPAFFSWTYLNGPYFLWHVMEWTPICASISYMNESLIVKCQCYGETVVEENKSKCFRCRKDKAATTHWLFNTFCIWGNIFFNLLEFFRLSLSHFPLESC